MLKSVPLLVLALGALAPAAMAGDISLEAQAGLVSDYRWRGVSLSDEDPSIQLEATASAESGLWAWGALNTVSSELGGSELNLGAGFTHALGPVELTLGALRYVYRGEQGFDYTELDASVAFDALGVSWDAGLEYAPAQDNIGGDDHYWRVNFEAPLPGDFAAFGHVGRDRGVMAPTPGAVDYEAGLSRRFGPFEAAVSFVDVDGADSTWVLRLTRSFEFK